MGTQRQSHTILPQGRRRFAASRQLDKRLGWLGPSHMEVCYQKPDLGDTSTALVGLSPTEKHIQSCGFHFLFLLSSLTVSFDNHSAMTQLPDQWMSFLKLIMSILHPSFLPSRCTSNLRSASVPYVSRYIRTCHRPSYVTLCTSYQPGCLKALRIVTSIQRT